MSPSNDAPTPTSSPIAQLPSLTTLTLTPTVKPTPPPESINIALIGAGISGLALAIGLQKYPHIKVTIYEAAPAFEEIGAGIGFGLNAMNATKLIDLRIYDGFLKIATGEWEWFNFYWGMKNMTCKLGDGKEIREDELLACSRFAEKFGDGEGPFNTVHRKDFLDILVGLIPEGTAVFNKRAVSIIQTPSGGKAEITFQDGSKAKADTVIGCDGIRSVVRDFVLGPDSKPAFVGRYCYRGLVNMERAKEILGERAAERQMIVGKHGHAITYPVSGGRILNIAAVRNSAGRKWEHQTWSKRVRKEEMLRDFEEHSEVVRKILGLLDEEQLQWAFFEHPPSLTYYKSNICLVGDAAHAMTPTLGAGAGQALEDAYILSNLLGACKSISSIKNAFSAYDAVRRPRTQEIMEASRKRAGVLALEDGGVWNGQADLGMVEETLVGEGVIGWIWDVDLEGELEKVRVIFRERESGDLGV